jgi:hypothetical protein
VRAGGKPVTVTLRGILPKHPVGANQYIRQADEVLEVRERTAASFGGRSSVAHHITGSPMCCHEVLNSQYVYRPSGPGLGSRTKNPEVPTRTAYT